MSYRRAGILYSLWYPQNLDLCLAYTQQILMEGRKEEREKRASVGGREEIDKYERKEEKKMTQQIGFLEEKWEIRKLNSEVFSLRI